MRCILLVLLFLNARVFADPPPGYYSPATGLSGLALKSALNGIIKNGHTVILYDDLFGPLKAIWQDPADSSKFILAYTGTSISKSTAVDSNGWNREHLWPRSRGNGEHLGPDDSDLFHVAPTDWNVNTQRGNLYFDTSNTADSGYTNPAHIEAPLCSRDSDSWEPIASQKGDIARALFYMATRYDGTEPNTQDLELVGLSPTGPQMGNLNTLLAWHAADPPDAVELARNELIFSAYQHNRNPFIDHPEYAAAIWGTGFGATPVAQATNGVEAAIESPLVAGSFIVRLSPPVTSGTVFVNFTTSGTATGADYAISGPGVSWNAGTGTGFIGFTSGVSAVTVTVSPLADGNPEPLETAQLTLLSGTGYANTGGPAKLTIADTTPSAPDGTIASWNFNIAPNAVNPRWSPVIPPSAGAGEVRLDGWSATSGSTIPGTNSNPNGVTGTALSLIGTGGNGRSLDVVVSTAGWAGMSASLFTRGSSTGYSTGTWSWSADGTNFTQISGLNTVSQSSSFQQSPLTVDVSAIGALNNLPVFTLRYTLSGATGSTGSSLIDDLSIRGTRYSQSWLARFPPLTGAAALRTADPDGDGLSNFGEWAFDLDPFDGSGQASRPGNAVAAPDPADGGIVKMWPTIQFARRTDSPSLTYVVEWSTNLTAWTAGGVLVGTEASGEAGSEIAIYRAGIPLTGNGSSTSVYLRARATIP
jgi:endonuclease I